MSQTAPSRDVMTPPRSTVRETSGVKDVKEDSPGNRLKTVPSRVIAHMTPAPSNSNVVIEERGAGSWGTSFHRPEDSCFAMPVEVTAQMLPSRSSVMKRTVPGGRPSLPSNTFNLPSFKKPTLPKVNPIQRPPSFEANNENVLADLSFGSRGSSMRSNF